MNEAGDQIILSTEGLTKSFGDTGRSIFGRKDPVYAVNGVNLELRRGETLALVGESGCGKSTLGRLLLRLLDPTSGSIHFDGTDLAQISRESMRQYRRRLQMIFQDPYGSLSPRRTIEQIIAEPLQVFNKGLSRKDMREEVAGLLEKVGLSPDLMSRYPRNFSGGQRQRIGIARAISVAPEFIVADEPVSALDVSVQAQIINLLQDIQRENGFTILFISHDLAVVRHIADRIAVMYLGKIVEIGSKRDIYDSPHHPYTQALLSAAPRPNPKRASTRIVLQGDVPSPSKIPSGCSFHTRCPLAQPVCHTEVPELKPTRGTGQMAACHFAAPNPIRRETTTS